MGEFYSKRSDRNCFGGDTGWVVDRLQSGDEDDDGFEETVALVDTETVADVLLRALTGQDRTEFAAGEWYEVR